MNRVQAALRAIAHELDVLDRRWALVGGLAVSARSEPRTTRDVDVVVAVTDDRDAESLVHRLGAVGYAVEATVEHRAVARLATARLRSPGAARVLVDLLFASSGLEADVATSAERIRIGPRLIVPVATVGHLVAQKLLSRNDASRPQDIGDLRQLLTVASANDLEVAREAVRLIAERGYARGRDLDALLRAAIAETHHAR